MKNIRRGSRFLTLFLALAMVVAMLPLSVSAAKGDLDNDVYSTGLIGGINVEDTISLPIKIFDYENDGMLFEYAEAYASGTGTAAAKTATDFGATFATDFCSASSIANAMCYNLGHATRDLVTGTYANYMRATYIRNGTEAPFTAYGRSGAIIPNDLGGLALDSIRYLVLVYRSNVETGNIGFFVERTNADRNNTKNRVGDLSFTNKGDDGKGSSTNWTYAVYDLKQGNLANSWTTTNLGTAASIWTTFPMKNTSQWIDIAHVALFSDATQAAAFGEYAITDGSDRGDNRAFGLLRGSRTQGDAGSTDTNGLGSAFFGIFKYNNTSADYGAAIETITQLGWTTENINVNEVATNLGYTLLGEFRGIANAGLLESSLSEDGYPVYKEEVVTYLAYLLKDSLELEERDPKTGWKNYRYVKGTPSPVYGNVDLATALRNAIDDKTISNGDCNAAKNKQLIGKWSDINGNISTYHDAAYFLLNSIFFPDSYNIPQDDYNYLVLSAGTDATTSKKVYVFDGGFTSDANGTSAVTYDTDKHTIQNNAAAYKTAFQYSDKDGDKTTLNPFLPVTDGNNEAGQTNNLYYQDDGVINRVKKTTGKDTLYKRDFNYVMVSEGEFVYHADDELFFEFEGDDDVYLFINNELVLDLGSAHGIDYYRFNLNDYVNAAKAGTLGSDATRNERLALVEGETYEFKFYYMERHSYGSNIRICTNIRVTDPSMVTAKTAWQDGTQLDFGSVVDKDKVVEYGFAITNNGQENLHNLTFTDNDIGVTLDPTNGLKVTGSRVYDVTDKDEDTALEASDLTAVVSHPNYADINVSFASDEELNAFLANLTVPATTAAALDDNVFSSGSGLPVGYTVTIRGIGYMLSDAQIGDGVFDNTVLTTSTNKTVSETLYGQASMRVFVPADPMYYQWAGHDLSVTKTKLISDIMGAIADPNNPLYDKDSLLRADNVNKIELVTKAGTAISSPYVTIDSSYNLTIKYDTTGSKVFYVKVTYNSSKNTVIIPVLVNVTSVQDSVYVLDYGLSVDLTQNNELTKNDTLTVPGRATTSEIIAIGSDGAYSKNEITFTSDDDVIDKIYGTFTLNGQTLTYLPDAFMEDVDTIQVAVNVYESDTEPSKITGTLDINNEVEMYKSITVLPANVVYYEDCFPAIEYKVTADKMDQTVNSITSLTQSADQDQEYGQDAAYQNNSDKSAGALTTITIQDSTIVASFEFKGTGFELIGRTNTSVGNGNTDGSATMTVKVLDKNGTVKNIPVITEFDNGGDGGDEEIYQVPVIRVKDLTLDTYTVQISGVPARDYDTLDANGNPTVIPSYLYVDGLRIFQPLGDKNEYYNASENGAQFIEIRDEIVEGNILAVDKSNTAITISGGTSTWTENLDQANELGTDGNIISYNEVSSVDDYLLKGPNNEVYLNGYNKDSAIVLYVKEIGTGAHNLQLALRAVDYGKFFIGEETGTNAVVNYGISGDNDTFAWKELIKATSSTEQYYTINYNECPYIEDKSAYQIVIQIGDVSMASFTSLKLTGLELVSAGGEPATMRYNNGTLEKLDPVEGTWETADALSAPAFYAISAQMSSDVIVGEDEPDTPAEDLPTDEPETETPETDVPAEPETPTVPEDKPEDKPENNGRPSNSDVSKTYRKLLEILRRLMAR